MDRLFGNIAHDCICSTADDEVLRLCHEFTQKPALDLSWNGSDRVERSRILGIDHFPTRVAVGSLVGDAFVSILKARRRVGKVSSTRIRPYALVFQT